MRLPSPPVHTTLSRKIDLLGGLPSPDRTTGMEPERESLFHKTGLKELVNAQADAHIHYALQLTAINQCIQSDCAVAHLSDA